MASVTASGSWLPARASTIASEARSAASGCWRAWVVVVVSWGPVGVVPRTVGRPPNEVEEEDELARGVVAVILIGGKRVELVVVGDVFEGAELLDCVTDVAEDSTEVDDDCTDGSDGIDWISVVVVLGSVEVVNGGSVEVDVVVVSSGCVVVVLDDVVEDSVVVGESLDVVVCHTVTVLLGSGTVVVLVSVDEVVASVVVVGSGSVVLVVLDVLVAADVVGWMGETDVSRSY